MVLGPAYGVGISHGVAGGFTFMDEFPFGDAASLGGCGHEAVEGSAWLAKQLQEMGLDELVIILGAAAEACLAASLADLIMAPVIAGAPVVCLGFASTSRDGCGPIEGAMCKLSEVGFLAVG